MITAPSVIAVLARIDRPRDMASTVAAATPNAINQTRTAVTNGSD